MLITTINAENLAAFEHLIAPEITAEMFDSGVLALGAVCEEDKLRLAAGVMVFSIEYGDVNGEIETAAVIKWLLVDEEFRGRGAADALMAEFIRVVGLSGVDNVICDLPMPEEYNGLCAYLESMGFEFTLAEIPELDTTLEAVFSFPAFQSSAPTSCLPLSQVVAAHFAKQIEKLKQQPYVPERLNPDKDYYDTDLSCVLDESGILLVTCNPDFGLELLYIGASDSPQHKMGEMALFAVNAARAKYSADTPLRISCRTPAGAATINKLFPSAQPRLVRRGYLSIYALFEEAEI